MMQQNDSWLPEHLVITMIFPFAFKTVDCGILLGLVCKDAYAEQQRLDFWVPFMRKFFASYCSNERLYDGFIKLLFQLYAPVKGSVPQYIQSIYKHLSTRPLFYRNVFPLAVKNHIEAILCDEKEGFWVISPFGEKDSTLVFPECILRVMYGTPRRHPHGFVLTTSSGIQLLHVQFRSSVECFSDENNFLGKELGNIWVKSFIFPDQNRYGFEIYKTIYITAANYNIIINLFPRLEMFMSTDDHTMQIYPPRNLNAQ